MAQYHVVTLLYVVARYRSKSTLLTILNSCIEHYFALIAACMPTLGPFFRWLRPSHWKHENLEGHAHHDAEAFQRAWPKPHKTFTDASLMDGSINIFAPLKNKNNPVYEMHSRSFPQHTQESLEPGWMRSDAYGGHEDPDIKNIAPIQEAEEQVKLKQTLRNSVGDRAAAGKDNLTPMWDRSKSGVPQTSYESKPGRR